MDPGASGAASEEPPTAGSSGTPVDPAKPQAGENEDDPAPPGRDGDGDDGELDGSDESDDDDGSDGDQSGTAGSGSTRPDGASGGQSGDPFFDALFGLINDIVQLEPLAAVGSLLAVLSAATEPDPAALGGLILLIDDANICELDRSTCDVACGLLVGQCRACAGEPTCHEAMERTCGDLTDHCQ
jgi:hypothetical protein